MLDYGNEFTGTNGINYTWEDGDTLLDNEGKKYRLLGFDAAEVEHEEGAAIKSPGTNLGDAQSSAIADVVSKFGYNNIQEEGTDVYGRTLIRLFDNNGEELSNKLYGEGILEQRGPMSTEARMAYDQGELFRAQNGDDESSYFGKTRSMLKEARANDMTFIKQTAPTEYWKKNGGARFNDDVLIRQDDRNLVNDPNSVFLSSFGQGLDGLQAGLYGLTEAIGAKNDLSGLESWGKTGVMANTEAQKFNRPSWIQNYSEINTDNWKKGFSDATDWATGLVGGSLPYIMPYLIPGGGLLTTGAATGTLGASYAGQVWNEMEGTTEEKSLGLALMAGAGMATIDRLSALGLKTLGMKASDFSGTESINAAVKKLVASNDITTQQAEEILKKESLGAMADTLSTLGHLDKVKLSKLAYSKGIATKAGKGFTVEGSTEMMQEFMQYGAAVGGSQKEWNQEDFEDLMINAGLGGGLLGGGFGTVGGVITNPQELRDLRYNYAEVDEDLVDMESNDSLLAQVNVPDNVAIQDKEGNTRRESPLLGKITKWIEEADAGRDGKGYLNRTWQDVLDKRFYRTNLEILRNRIGESRYLQSPKTRALVDKFGWTTDRTTAGATYQQKKRRRVSQYLTPLQEAQERTMNLLGLKRSAGDVIADKRGGKASATAFDFLASYQKWVQDTHTSKLTKRVAPKAPDDRFNDPTFRKELNEIVSLVFAANEQRVKAKKEFKGTYDEALDAPFNPAMVSKFKVKKDRDGFISKLMQKRRLTRKQAEDYVDDLVDTPDGYKAKEYHAAAPVRSSVYPESMIDVKVDLTKDDDFKDFMVRDGFAAMQQDAVETANFLVDMSELGPGGSKIYAELDAAMQETGDPELVRSVLNNIEALRGTYNRIESDKLRKIQTVIGTVQMYAYLPFAGLASIPELAVSYLGIHGRDAMVSHTKNMGKMAARGLLPFMSNRSEVIFGNEQEVKLFERARTIMYNEGYLRTEHSAIGLVDVDSDIINMSKRMRNISNAYFNLIGLKPYTDYTRLIRAASGQDFVMEKMDIVAQIDQDALDGSKPMKRFQMDAIKSLRELGVDPHSMVENHKKFIKLAQENNADSYDDLLSLLESDTRGARMADSYNTAVTNFIDAAIVNPDPTKKPLFYSDDRFRLLFQFQGFMSVFTTTTLRKIWKDVVSENPQAQYASVAMIGTMMLLGFMSQAMRDELKYQGTPSWLSESKEIQRAVGASGVLGQSERLLNMFFPLYGSNKETLFSKAIDELGPAARTAINLSSGVANMAEGEAGKAANQFLKLVPGLGVSTSNRQAVAESIDDYFK